MRHEEGIRLHVSTKSKTFAAAILIILTLATSLYSFLPISHATAPTTITFTVTPASGIVGQSVSVNGTIETSVGVFNIFFDSAKVKNGTAINYNFTTSFIVPQATYGPHNITVQDVSANVTSHPQTFTVRTSYAISPFNLPAAPGQLQEGDSVQIKAQIFGGNSSTTYNKIITVTSPANANYSATVQMATNQSGTAENSTLYYPTNFSTAGRNTNYTGTYYLRIYKNATAYEENSFFIGLTNASYYHRFDWVNIKAMNYTTPNEWANITITFGSTLVNKTRIQVINGQVVYNWQVPANASIGTYTVSVKSLNSTTVKAAPDVQNFIVPGFAVIFSTVNLNHEYVGGVNATVYQIDPFNANKTSQVATGVTAKDGNITYTLERGNYSVTAYWENVQVNETTLIHVQNSSSWTIICQLTRIALTVFDKKTGNPLPFLEFVLNSTYRTSSNKLQNETQVAITNTTATCIFDNQLINASYKVGVYRAEQLMNDSWTPLPTIPLTKMFNFNITCPDYNLTIHAEDARQATLRGYPIMIYDYGGGLYANATTDSSGNHTFSLAFGAYQIRLYDNVTRTIVLNETIYTLVSASSLLLRSSICDANLSVTVVDYLGLPIPNVRVKLEPEGVVPMEIKTNGNGVAFFGNVIGGNSIISVYVGDETPSYTTNVYVEGNTVVSVSLGKYVSVLGVIIDTSQFAVLLTLIVFIIAFALFIVYQRRKSKASAAEAAEKKT
jgi:hypothetical protein